MSEQQLNQIETKIEMAVNKFNKDVKEIRESDHPKYNDQAVRDYDLRQIRQQLDEEVDGLKAEYKQIADGLLAEAERKAARSSFQSPANTAAIDTVLADFAADVALAYSEHDKQAAYKKLSSAIANMDINEMAHVRRKLPAIIGQASDEATVKQLRHINSVLSEELKTPERLEYERLKERTSDQGALSYNTLRLTNRLYADHQASVRASMR